MTMRVHSVSCCSKSSTLVTIGAIGFQMVMHTGYITDAYGFLFFTTRMEIRQMVNVVVLTNRHGDYLIAHVDRICFA